MPTASLQDVAFRSLVDVSLHILLEKQVLPHQLAGCICNSLDVAVMRPIPFLQGYTRVTGRESLGLRLREEDILAPPLRTRR